MSDRKYRHRGYGDTYHEPEGSSRGAKSGPRPQREGPRGRGLGAPTADVFRCRDCGEKQQLEAAITAESRCPRCGAALHSCVNCTHFDTAARFECRKPVESRQPSKTKANECPHWQAKQAREFGADSSSQSDARSAFDALFKI